MQIILQEDVEKLGNRGELVEVAEGYARNFLLPRKLGLEATAGNLKRLERMRAHFAKKEATEKDAAQKQGEQLAAVSLEFTRKAGENDQLFGSVTSLDVAEALAGKGFEIDRKKIVLAEPIKVMGEYEVPVKLHREVIVMVKVALKKEEKGGFRFTRRAVASRWDSGIAGELGVSKFGTPFFCAAAFPLFRFIAQGGTVDAAEVNAHNPACSLNRNFYARGECARVVAECKRA